MPVHDDLIGCNFGLWKVIEQAEDYIQPATGWHKRRYLCECGCENHTRRLVLESHLKNGKSTNCGCIRKTSLSKSNTTNKKKYNKYNLTGEYGIGYTSKGDEFYFDLEDYEKIRCYCWTENRKGYIVTNSNGKEISLHALVMNRVDEASDNKEIDHINGNESRNDNRKSNLRVCSRSNNAMNRGLQSNNKSNYTGVYYDKNLCKYKAYITINKKQIYLGIFSNKKDAIKVRKEAEDEYFGEYSYENSQNKRRNK